MNLTYWANGAWANGSWNPLAWGTSSTPASTTTVVVGAGGDLDWRDWVKNRNLSLQKVKYQIVRARKKVKKLVERATQLEREVSVARSNDRPIEGILATYQNVSERVEVEKQHLLQLKIEYNEILSVLPELAKQREIEEDDEEILMLL